MIGAGAWGTALAISAAQSQTADRRVSLWARDARQSDDMRQSRANARYLPGVPLPGSLRLTHKPLDAQALWLSLLHL